jgi:hypothetical protein
MYPKKALILILSLSLAAYVSQAGQKADPRLSPLEPLLNKTWVGALKAPDGSAEFKVVRRFEAVWDGKVIKYTKTNLDLNNSGEGYIYWDDISKKPAFFFIENSGVFLKGFISAENNLFTFEGAMTWPQPNPQGEQSFEFRNTFEITSESEMTDRWFHNAFGPWRRGHVIKFKAEDKQTKPSLPDDSYSKMHIIDGHTHMTLSPAVAQNRFRQG